MQIFFRLDFWQKQKLPYPGTYALQLSEQDALMLRNL